MKKFLSMVLMAAMLLTLGAAFPKVNISASAATAGDEIGSYDIQRFNNLWGTPSSNVVLAITPGNALTGKYFNKIYAEYDSDEGCYIVQKKVWNLRDFNEDGSTFVVPQNGLGLLFNYAPLSALSDSRLREMWMTWQQVKVGDKVYLSDMDVATLKLGSSPKATFKVGDNRPEPADTPLTGKTIVALGDSITVGGGWTEELEDFFGCRVVNAGMGGDTAAGALSSRFDMLVPQHNPDFVIISYGINDCLAARLDKPTLKHIEDFKANMKKLYDKATAIGAKVVFQNANNIKVSVYEESHNKDGRFDEFNGVQGYIDLWEQSLKDLARELEVPLVDLYNMWRQEIPSDTAGITEYLVDTVHPNDKGFDKNMEVIINTWGWEICTKYFADLSKADGCPAVVEDGIIKNVPEGTTVAEFKAMFSGARNAYRGNLLLTADTALQTGDEIDFRAEGENYVIVVPIEMGNYTVDFKATTGGSISATQPLSLPYGTAVSSIALPTPTANEGYRFARWYVSDSIVSENMTIVAEFEQVTHTVSFVASTGGALLGATSVTVLDGTSYTAITFPEVKALKGYEFVKWEKSVEGSKVKSDVTITAIFQKIADCTVTFVAGEGGTLSGTTSVDVASGTAVSTLTFPTANANDGYAFDKWEYSANTVTGDMTITAVFKKLAALGDVNADGRITALDASLILQYDAMLINSLENMEGADVSGDGRITALDASLILQYDAMLIQDFPANK